MRPASVLLLFSLLPWPARADDAADVKALLARETVGPRQARLDAEEFIRKRVPRMPKVKTATGTPNTAPATAPVTIHFSISKSPISRTLASARLVGHPSSFDG